MFKHFDFTFSPHLFSLCSACHCLFHSYQNKMKRIVITITKNTHHNNRLLIIKRNHITQLYSTIKLIVTVIVTIIVTIIVPFRSTIIQCTKNSRNRIFNVDEGTAVLAVCSRYNAPFHTVTPPNSICSFLQFVLERCIELLCQFKNGIITK